MQFDDVIMGRRSIRGYKPDPVPRKLIEEIIGLAMRAPSSMNTQPYNFYIITGEPLDRIRRGNTERNVAGVRQSREFHVFQAGAMTIETRHRRVRVAIDGEVTVMAPPLRYRFRPAALPVIVPYCPSVTSTRHSGTPIA